MKKVLIVCTGNRVLSPMAAEIANSIAKKRMADYSFDSAGLAVIDKTRDNNTVQVLEEIGIFTSYTPKPVQNVNVDRYEQIHVMNQRQKFTLCSVLNRENIMDKIVVLGVETPFTQGIDAYRQCRDRLVGIYEAFLA